MTRNRLALTLAIALSACAAPAFAQQDIDKINGGITAEAGQSYGDLETVNGGIDLESGAKVEDISTVNGGIEGGNDIQADSIEAVNGGVRLGERVQVGNIETVNGGIFLDRGSRVARNIENVNGGIGIVGTVVGGDISTVSGDITVGADAHVKGGLRVEKPDNHGFSINWGKQRPPRIVIGPNAVVDGPLVFERDVTLYVHTSARIGRVSGATAKPYSTATPPEE
ncbi:MAG: hypothetical protein M3Y70_10360 [Pseudomonadota bacterium]|nr:hypothetical protein [Pseudomonadota bacterium]